MPEEYTMSRKPTIHELEAILEEEEDTPIEILPNGEVRTLGGSDAWSEVRASPSPCAKTSVENMVGQENDLEPHTCPTGYCESAAAF